MEYDPLYIRFFYEFNVTRDYFECHELMEQLWLEDGRNAYYQGLLQAAVGLYHCRNDNLSGAVKLMNGAVDKLDRYPQPFMGVKLDLLLAELRAYIARLEQHMAKDGAIAGSFAFADLSIQFADDQLEKRIELETHEGG